MPCGFLNAYTTSAWNEYFNGRIQEDCASLQDVNTKEFALYPNPAKSFVVLEFETLQENTPLQIFDMNGRTLRSLDLKAGRELLKIDLGDLPKRVYAIKFGNAIRKLVVE